MSRFKPWRVLNLSLESGMPDLVEDPTIDGTYVVFWWHGLPLGQVDIPAAMLPVTSGYLTELALKSITPAVGDGLLDYGFRAALPMRRPRRDGPPDYHALNALDRPLERLSTRWRQFEAAAEPSISVVICTRNRPDALERCLRSLHDLSEQPVEIIVVDNDPQTDATRRLVSGMANIRYVAEERKGLSAARNTGLRAATGDIIAFTDDDVRVHPNWLTGLRRGFFEPDVMAVTGLVVTAELETPAQLEFHRGNGGFGWGFRALNFGSDFFERSNPHGVPVWHIGAGANMAFRREVFDRAGLFDERLGAGASGCSEDSEMWYRVLAGGSTCRYEPTAVVFHYHRREMEALDDQMYQYMRGHMTALLVQFERFGDTGNLYRAFGIIPFYYGKLALRPLFRRRNPRMRTLRSQVLGCIAGLGYYWRHRRPEKSTS